MKELSFEVAFGGADSFWILNDGVFGTGWDFDTTTGFVAWNAFDIGGGDGTSTPEPATLLVLGLGLAGLAVARRRRK